MPGLSSLRCRQKARVDAQVRPAGRRRSRYSNGGGVLPTVLLFASTASTSVAKKALDVRIQHHIGDFVSDLPLHFFLGRCDLCWTVGLLFLPRRATIFGVLGTRYNVRHVPCCNWNYRGHLWNSDHVRGVLRSLVFRSKSGVLRTCKKKKCFFLTKEAWNGFIAQHPSGLPTSETRAS